MKKILSSSPPESVKLRVDSLKWNSKSVIFSGFNRDDISRRLKKAHVSSFSENRFLLIQIQDFFAKDEITSARQYFDGIPLNTKIITKTESHRVSNNDNPSFSFSYETGVTVLNESENFIGTINQFLAWLGNETQSTIQLYTNYQSSLSSKPYIDSAFICNKIFSMSEQQSQASIHTDYPYVKGNGDQDCFFNFTLTVFVTSENFKDTSFGTRFITDTPQSIPCIPLQINIFTGDCEHGFSASSELSNDPGSWRASITWKCRAVPTVQGISLRDAFKAWADHHERPACIDQKPEKRQKILT